VTLETQVDCEQGSYTLAGQAIHDPRPVGVVTVGEIMARGSNIGIAKLGLMLGKERLNRYLVDFGFGQRTGVPLTGEVKGILHPLERQDAVTASRLPLGYGLAASLMQMVTAVGTVANQGVCMRPLLVDHLENSTGRVLWRAQPEPRRRVLSPQAGRKAAQAMEAVAAPGGVGTKAAIEGVRVAGCTGTAMMASLGEYAEGKFYLQFIGFCPVDAPVICFGVAIEEPAGPQKFASEIAAPVFEKTVRRVLDHLSRQGKQ
jgi:cell division protein FtsI/penicillin-binding protein 2